MLAMTIVTNVPGNTAKAAWNAYYFGNLTYVSQWGVSSRSVTDGALKVTFNSKYGEVKYNAKNWGYDDFEITKSGSGSIKTIGVMSQSSSTYTATIYNVRITINSGSSTGGRREVP